MTRVKLTNSSGKPYSKADLTDASLWSFGDLELFGKLLRTLEVDFRDINKWKETADKSLSELKKTLLKGSHQRLSFISNLIDCF